MNKISILELSSLECEALIDDLRELYDNIEDKVNSVMKKADVPIQEALEYVVTNSPILWAKVYLNWTCRDYQYPILIEGRKSKQVVLRLGRRLGKTDSMCVLIWWYAYTQLNKGPNEQYNILILTPYETQVDLIFDRLKQLLEGSPLLEGMVTRDIHHRYELSNGTIITGLTAGASSGNSGSNNTRGQRADLIVLDEVDYIGSSQITNIINIRNEAPERIRILAASTPCGKHEEFYKWCTDASKSYLVRDEDIKNIQFTGYDVKTAEERGEKGNGWTEIWAPSLVNKELLKINKDTGQTYLQDLKDELSELRFEQEVMAMFGDEEMGVYQKKFINAAVEEGRLCGHRYINFHDENEVKAFLRRRRGPLVLGVDWDKYQAGTNMVALYLDKEHRNKDGVFEPKFKVLFSLEIPKTEFTYVNAVNKIVELNDIFDFDWIAIDRGYGETQLELLKQYGIANPHSGLADKVVGYQFGEKIELRDPHTGKKVKKHLKPFMVNNSVITFEKEKIVLDPQDKNLIEQLESYTIKSISSTGMPTFSSENEHSLDAMNLCLLIIEQKYGALFKNVIATRILSLKDFNRKDEVIKRDVEPNTQVEPPKQKVVGLKDKSNLPTRTKIVSTSRNSSRMYKRSSF